MFLNELLLPFHLLRFFLVFLVSIVLLSITKDPLLWYNVPIIFLKRGNDSIRKIAGRKSKEKYAAFTDFFDKNGNYKLASQLESSYKSSLPNQFEKDFIDVDRKINLLFSALDGKILKIFPTPALHSQ